MYYKNKENKPYYEPSQSVIRRDELVEISKKEFEQIIVQINTPSPEQILEQQIAEASQYLQATDWYYARKAETGEEVPEEVVQKRVQAREFLKGGI